MSGPWEAYAALEQGPWSQFAPQGDQRSGVQQALAAAGQFGAGANSRMAQVVGAPVDLVGRGLRAAGVPVPENAIGGSQSIQELLNALIGQAPAPQNTTERLARGAGGGVVDAASVMVPASIIARGTQAVGQAPTMTNRVATALAGQPALQVAAGMTGGAVGEATDSPLAGAVAAFAVPLAAAGAGRLVSPVRNQLSPARAALVAAAERERIPVTAGQATGSRALQNVEAQLEQLPFTAGPQRALREGQQEAFIRAVMRRTGTEASDTSPETINAIRSRIGGTINQISNRNTLQFTPALDGELRQIEDSLRFIPAEAAAPVRARIEQLRGMVIRPETPPGSLADPADMPAGAIPGASYRMMDSQLGRSMRSTQNGDLRAALGDLRERLRAAMDASISPEDAQAWQKARRQYANLMVIAQAAGRAGADAAEGRMSPVALRQALDQSTGRGYVYGRGDLNELARIGQGVLRPPPDSGTAGRTMANSLLTGGGATAGTLASGSVLGGLAGGAAALALPRIIQAGMNTGMGQAYLRNQAVQNPIMTDRLLAALLAQQGTGYATAQPR